MKPWIHRLEIPFLAAFLIAGTIYLLALAYLSVFVSTPIGIAFAVVFYAYVKLRYGVRVPPFLLVLVLGAIQVDALGNYFQMYGRAFGPVQYDEFSHFLVQVLLAPIVVWMMQKGLAHFGYQLPLGLVTFFAVTTIFSCSAFYEVIELWDALYVHPGERIHGPFDAPNDLQWNLLGILVGTLLNYAALKLGTRSAQPDAGAAAEIEAH